MTDIGVVQLFFIDPGLVWQSVPTADEERQIQVAEWEIQEAVLDLGTVQADLLFEETCRYVDTVLISPRPDPNDACADSIVLESNEEPLSATLTLTFTMKVRRAEPVDLADPLADPDGDGVDNASDNCPIEPNPGQQDDDLDGVGNACTDAATGLPDNDADSIRDGADNCVEFDNPNQEDDMDGVMLGGVNVPDGIGDACTEQIAQVQDLQGNALIEAMITIDDFVLPRQGVLLTVDFDNQVTLQCDWEAGTCDLDPGQLRACVNTSALTLGCP